jgi:hypothetical protein
MVSRAAASAFLGVRVFPQFRVILTKKAKPSTKLFYTQVILEVGIISMKENATSRD